MLYKQFFIPFAFSFIQEILRAKLLAARSPRTIMFLNLFADSGMVSSMILCEILSKTDKKLSELLDEFRVYHTIEETNVKVEDKKTKIAQIKEAYSDKAKTVDEMDGLTVEFGDWWFNVRPSNTEPFLRLNLEANSQELMEEKKQDVLIILTTFK